jgi:hypothetical protein
MFSRVSTALVRTYAAASGASPVMRGYATGKTDLVTVQLFERKAISASPWAGGVASDQVVSIPSQNLSIDCSFPRSGEPYVRTRKVVQEGTVRVSNKPNCKTEEDPQAMEVSLSLVEEACVPAHKIRTLNNLEKNLAEMEKKRDELNRRIQESVYWFNSICNDVRWHFQTPPKDVILKPSKELINPEYPYKKKGDYCSMHSHYDGYEDSPLDD